MVHKKYFPGLYQYNRYTKLISYLIKVGSPLQYFGYFKIASNGSLMCLMYSLEINLETYEGFI